MTKYFIPSVNLGTGEVSIIYMLDAAWDHNPVLVRAYTDILRENHMVFAVYGETPAATPTIIDAYADFIAQLHDRAITLLKYQNFTGYSHIMKAINYFEGRLYNLCMHS